MTISPDDVSSNDDLRVVYEDEVEDSKCAIKTNKIAPKANLKRNFNQFRMDQPAGALSPKHSELENERSWHLHGEAEDNSDPANNLSEARIKSQSRQISMKMSKTVQNGGCLVYETLDYRVDDERL
jgi:hypothetical protein